MFGHLPDELVDKPLSVLVPEWYRDLYAGHLDRFMIDPTPRMMGAGLELRALRKDGGELSVEISQSRLRKSAQDAKCSFCLTAGMMSPRIRRDHEQTSTPEPHTGLQGEGGACRRQG